MCFYIYNLSQSSHKNTFSTNFQLYINDKFKFKLVTFSLASHLFNCRNCNLSLSYSGEATHQRCFIVLVLVHAGKNNYSLVLVLVKVECYILRCRKKEKKKERKKERKTPEAMEK